MWSAYARPTRIYSWATSTNDQPNRLCRLLLLLILYIENSDDAIKYLRWWTDYHNFFCLYNESLRSRVVSFSLSVCACLLSLSDRSFRLVSFRFVQQLLYSVDSIRICIYTRILRSSSLIHFVRSPSLIYFERVAIITEMKRAQQIEQRTK